MDDVRRTPSHGVRIEDLVEQVHPPLDHPSALVANTATTASADEVGSGVVIGWVSARCQTPGQAGPGRPPQLASLLKGAEGPEVLHAVLAVAEGDAVFGPSVARRIMTFYSGGDEPYAVQAFRSSRCGSGRLWTCWPQASATERSRDGWACPRRPSATTSPRLMKLQAPDRTAAAIKARDAGLGHR